MQPANKEIERVNKEIGKIGRLVLKLELKYFFIGVAQPVFVALDIE